MKKKFPLQLIPIGLIFTLFPLLTLNFSYRTNLSSFSWFDREETLTDRMLYVKMLFLLILGIFIVCRLIYQLFFKYEYKHIPKCFFFLLGYDIFVIVSTIYSVHPFSSLNGNIELFESVWILLIYTFLCLYCYLNITTDYAVHFLQRSILAGSAILCLIGLYQMFFSADHVVYMTLYNSNYAAAYILLLFPIILMSVFNSSSKWIRCISCVISILLFICLIGTHTTFAYFVFFIELVAILWSKRNYFSKYVQAFLTLFFLAVIIGICFRELPSVFSDGTTSVYALSGIETSLENVKVHYQDQVLEVTTQNCETFNQEGISFHNTEYNNLQGFEMITGDTRFFFTNETFDHAYRCYTIYNRLCDVKIPDMAVFSNHQELFSSRGYIWARTLPLLQNSLFIGYGPDTFPVIFPQNDYGNACNYGYLFRIITKPHCLYLQIATQTGIVSLALWLCFFISIICHYLKSKNKNSLTTAIVISIVGYLLFGFLNDSCIAVAPLFWCLCGISLTD